MAPPPRKNDDGRDDEMSPGAEVEGVPVNLLLSQRPLTDYIMGLLRTQPVGNEIDHVVRSFGHIAEDYRVGGHTGYGDVIAMRLRYQTRRDLADLTRFPEDYEFQHGLIDGSQRPVVLLTPPE